MNHVENGLKINKRGLFGLYLIKIQNEKIILSLVYHDQMETNNYLSFYLCISPYLPLFYMQLPKHVEYSIWLLKGLDCFNTFWAESNHTKMLFAKVNLSAPKGSNVVVSRGSER